MISTKIIKIDPVNPQQSYLKEAADVLRNGGLVIMPTETVYGIAANMLNKKTLARLCEIKARPKDKPFSLHISEKEEIEGFATAIPIPVYKLIDKFWPGPLTLILKAKTQGTIGLRMPDNDIALKVISSAGVPIVCPSANISGKPAPVNFEKAIQDLEGLVDFAIDAGATKLKKESSIVDLTVEPMQILRIGAIKKEDIEGVVKRKAVLFICTGNSCRSVMAKELLEKRIKEEGRQDIEVLSAGVMMSDGYGASDETKELLAREGIDVSNHRPQQLTAKMINKSDLVLVMEKKQEERILELFPQVKFRVFLLKEFAKINNNNLDIADPIGKSAEFYEKTLTKIKEAVERISNLI